LHCTGSNRLYSTQKMQILLELAKTEFSLHNFKIAKELLLSHKNYTPLEPQSHYLLGCIYEREKTFSKAATFYQDALRLGMARIEPLLGLLRISFHLKNKDGIIKYINTKYRDFKKEVTRLNKLNLKKKKIKGLIGLKKKMFILEKKLKRR